MEATSADVATTTTKMVQSGVSGTLQYLNPDYMPPSLDSKNSPLAMLARTCNSIGKDSQPSKPAHQSQQHHHHHHQQQQQPADKKDNSTRLIKSTSPGKKSTVGVDGATSRKDTSSTLSRQSTAAAGRRRSSLSPTSSQLQQCRDGDASSRRADGGTRWASVNDGAPTLSSGGSPASTSRTADSDRDSVDELRCSAPAGRHRDRQTARQTVSPYGCSDAPPSIGLYESLRLQQEVAALQAAVYSPLHQLMAQRHFTDPLAMYSASLQAAAVVAAAATQASLRSAAAARLPGKDYRLGDVLMPCGVDTADLMSNGDVDGGAMCSATGLLPLRPPVPPVGPCQQQYTCSWLTAGGEFCAQRFLTSDELFTHLRTHVDGAAAASEEPLLRSALPSSAASCSAFSPTGGFLGGQSAVLPVAGTFRSAASLAAAHAASSSSFYRNKVQRSGRSVRDAAVASPTSTAAAGASLLLPAAAAAAATSRYHPYKWTPSPFVASQLASALATGATSDLTAAAPPSLSALLQQPPYASLFSAQTLGAAVP